CPHRDSSGLSLLFQYYNQLYFVERRFFPPDRTLPIYFEWFDSLTGVPSSQRTVAFEKACVLFNLAALYTQMGAKQARGTAKGLDQAVDHFLRAAGSLGYLRDNFTNGPSIDLAQDMLNMLVHLMLAQARECLLEKLQLQSQEKRDVDIHFDLALEAQELSKRYEEVTQLMSPVSDYLPYSWASLCNVKSQHYAALGHASAAAGLSSASQGDARAEQLVSLASEAIGDAEPKQRYPVLRAAYLNKASNCQEEAARLHRMCRELRAKSCLTRVLQAVSVSTEKEKESLPRTCSALAELVEPAKIPGKSKFSLRPTPPDFGQVPASDLFQGLGPLAVFSAKNRWSPPRTIQLHQRSGSSGYGFSITTDSPTVVTNVQPNSLAQIGGMKEGDFIVAIDDVDVKWSSHEQVVNLIKAANSKLTLKIVTPTQKNKTKSKEPKLPGASSTVQQNPQNQQQKSQQKTPSPSSGEKKLWNPFKKPQLEKTTSLNVDQAGLPTLPGGPSRVANSTGWPEQSCQLYQVDQARLPTLPSGLSRVANSTKWTKQGCQLCWVDQAGLPTLLGGQTRVANSTGWTKQGCQLCWVDRPGLPTLLGGQSRVANSAGWTDQGCQLYWVARAGLPTLLGGLSRVAISTRWTKQGCQLYQVDQAGLPTLPGGQTRVANSTKWTKQGCQLYQVDRPGLPTLPGGPNRVANSTGWTEQSCQLYQVDRAGLPTLLGGQSRVANSTG
ncbi:hypothetical protein GE061_008751, partial [Apolygus lucorum]